MPDNTATTNPFDKQGIKEDLHNEFKTSVFIAPETSSPGIRQMTRIAESLAAFMNAEGGVLYIGVRDNKTICGIEKDLALLASQPQALEVHTPRYNDVGYEYGGTPDQYELKIRAIARAFLSPNANTLIGRIDTASFAGYRVCRIMCKACPKNEFVYSYRKFSGKSQETEEIPLRIGNQKITLAGAARDEFVRRRVEAGFDRQLEALRASMAATGNGAQNNEAVVSAVRELLDKLDKPNVIKGKDAVVLGAVPFTEETINNVSGPKTLVWERAHYAEVSGWQELVLKMLEKLQELTPATFDELAGKKEFAKQLIVTQKPKEKHGDCYATKFGADGKIRIKKSLGNKVYLVNSDSKLLKIIAAFGVDLSQFSFTAK